MWFCGRVIVEEECDPVDVQESQVVSSIPHVWLFCGLIPSRSCIGHASYRSTKRLKLIMVASLATPIAGRPRPHHAEGMLRGPPPFGGRKSHRTEHRYSAILTNAATLVYSEHHEDAVTAACKDGQMTLPHWVD